MRLNLRSQGPRFLIAFQRYSTSIIKLQRPTQADTSGLITHQIQSIGNPNIQLELMKIRKDQELLLKGLRWTENEIGHLKVVVPPNKSSLSRKNRRSSSSHLQCQKRISKSARFVVVGPVVAYHHVRRTWHSDT